MKLCVCFAQDVADWQSMIHIMEELTVHLVVGAVNVLRKQ